MARFEFAPAAGSATVLIAPQVRADVAQLVEHHLAKVRVAGSNPVVRSEGWHALAAEWPSGLGKGLQSPVHGFDSRLRLPYLSNQRKSSFGVCAGRRTVLASRS